GGVDGGAFAACTTSPSFTTPTLGGGDHTFEVRVADAATNSSTASRAFTVDTNAPTVLITSGPAGPTNVNTPTFTFTTAGSPTSIVCQFDGALPVDCGGLTFTATLADGPHTFAVTVT